MKPDIPKNSSFICISNKNLRHSLLTNTVVEYCFFKVIISSFNANDLSNND
jgi:hypothetical protein